MNTLAGTKCETTVQGRNYKGYGGCLNPPPPSRSQRYTGRAKAKEKSGKFTERFTEKLFKNEKIT